MTSDPSDLLDELPEDMIPPETSETDEEVDVPPEVEDWVDETKGVERIVTVAITTSKPRTAKWISDQAVVAEQTARDHLETFAKVGIISSFRSSGVKRYYADEGFIHYREVSRYVEEYSKEELSDHSDKIQSKLVDIKEKYDVERPDDLRAKAAQSEREIEEVRDLKKDASEWEMLSDRIEVIEDAIRRFDKLAGPARSVV